jgi:hypothetical protein
LTHNQVYVFHPPKSDKFILSAEIKPVKSQFVKMVDISKKFHRNSISIICVVHLVMLLNVIFYDKTTFDNVEDELLLFNDYYMQMSSVVIAMKSFAIAITTVIVVELLIHFWKCRINKN